MFENPRLITRDDPFKKCRIHLAIIQKHFCDENSFFLLFPCRDFKTPSLSPNSVVEFYACTRNIGTVGNISDHFWQSFLISHFTFSMLRVLHTVASQPARASSPIDSLPLWKRPTHFFTVVHYSSTHMCYTHSLVLL